MAEKLITSKEINSLVGNLRKLIMFINSANAIKNNPNAYNDRPTQTWSCHRYVPTPSKIPDSYKIPKYLRQSNDFAMTTNETMIVDSQHFNALKANIVAALNNLKQLYTYPNVVNKPSSVPAEVISIDSNTIAKLDHINAIIQSINTIASTIAQVDAWYNATTDLCNLSCQNYCQVGCQVVCQNVSWCHNQKCGIH